MWYILTNGVFWCCLPFHENTHRIGRRNRKKPARSIGQFGRNHFLVSGGYLQRPSNLLKCYQLNLSRKTLQTNFWHGNGLPRFRNDRQPNHGRCWKKSPVHVPLATKNLETLCRWHFRHNPQKLGWRFFGSFKYDWKLNQIHNRKEADHTLPFLDTLVRRNQHGKFSTSVYRKPTISNRYLTFDLTILWNTNNSLYDH